MKNSQQKSPTRRKYWVWVFITLAVLIALLAVPFVPVDWIGFANAPTAEGWQAYAAVLTLVVAVLTALAALIQLNSHLGSLDEARRPYLIADFHFRGGALAFIEIRNISASPAYDVRMRTDEPLQSDQDGTTKMLADYFSSTAKAVQYKMAMLAPGQRILYVYGHVPNMKQLELPTKTCITLEYSDRPEEESPTFSGPKRFLQRGDRTTFVEKNPLDLEQWWTTAERDEFNWVQNESRKYLKAVNSVIEELKKRGEQDNSEQGPPRSILDEPRSIKTPIDPAT